MASHPPGICCIVGVKHDGEPAGQMGTVGKCNITQNLVGCHRLTNVSYLEQTMHIFHIPKTRVSNAVLSCSPISWAMNSSMRNCTSRIDSWMLCALLMSTCSLADQFAANGYLTAIPDIWEGDNIPLNWEPTSSLNLGQWMSKHGPEKVEPIGEAAIHAMGNEHGIKKLAGAGYCLGAKYVSRFMAKERGLEVGPFAHPSATSSDEVKGISGPLSIAAAGR